MPEHGDLTARQTTDQAVLADRPAGGLADAAAQRLLERWLADLGARLRGPARARGSILAEFRGGLDDALAAGHAAGLAPIQAADAAIAEFGDPATVAAAFAPELAATHARRVGLTLIATGPLVGGLWLAALAASSPPLRPAIGADPPWQWPIVQAGGWPARAALAFVVVAVLAAWLAVAASGRLTRWLPVPGPPRLARAAAATAATGATILDLTLLAVLGIQAASSAAPARPLALPLVGVAVAAGLVRLTLASHAAHRCLTIPATPA
jgi:hypothetical protein